MSNPQEASGVCIVYDGQCPICSTYCSGLPAEFEKVDGRKASDLKDQITRLGLDLDEGFVVVKNGELLHGSAAMQALAGEKTITGWRWLLNKLMFATPWQTAIFYPLARLLRRLALWSRNTPLIRNLPPR